MGNILMRRIESEALQSAHGGQICGQKHAGGGFLTAACMLRGCKLKSLLRAFIHTDRLSSSTIKQMPNRSVATVTRSHAHGAAVKI